MRPIPSDLTARYRRGPSPAAQSGSVTGAAPTHAYRAAIPAAWQRALREVRHHTERVPLWARLVVVMLTLVAIAQVITGLVVLKALEKSLIERVDEQLGQAARNVARSRANGVDRSVTDALYRMRLPGPTYGQWTGDTGAPFSVLIAAADIPGPAIPPAALADPAAFVDSGLPTTVGSTSGPGRWRLTAATVTGSKDVVIVAVRLDEEATTLAKLATLDIVVSGVVLALLAGVGYLLVRFSLRPLRQVEAVAGQISSGQLDRRVPEYDPRTEVGRLALAFNAMLGRIEAAFHERESSEAQARASEGRMRRFIADASHELRTPLTSIRGFAELYRQGAARESADVDRFMGRIESESSRMALLVEDLLLLARLDQQRAFGARPVDLRLLAADAVHDAQALAPDRAIELSGPDKPATVVGDEARLRQVVGNLVDNALTHTPPATPVTVTVTADGASTVVLEVADRGPGMQPDQAAQVFERFYRADPARARQTGGNGLGLAITAAIVGAHGGTVEVDSTPGQGSVFRVRLPAG